MFTGKVELNAMLNAPVYEGHKRGKNWMAAIQLDPAAPGGIGRNFYPSAKGDYYYIIKGLEINTPVEFGADYISGGGNRTRRRWYGVVRTLTDSQIEIEQFPTARAAVEAGRTQE